MIRENSIAGKVIVGALSSAWAAGIGVASWSLHLWNEVTILEQRINALEKDHDSCVRKEIYEVDKMLMNERFRIR